MEIESTSALEVKFKIHRKNSKARNETIKDQTQRNQRCGIKWRFPKVFLFGDMIWKETFPVNE